MKKLYVFLIAIFLILSFIFYFFGVRLKFGGKTDLNAPQKLDGESIRYANKEGLTSNEIPEQIYKRNFSVRNPKIESFAAAIKPLDSDFHFYKLNFRSKWPLASITKLITAVVVVKNISPDKQISISSSTEKVWEENNNLSAGDIYKASDLLKIMLLSSSNRAAFAFEEYFGGTDKFLELANPVIQEIGMQNTVIYDASGLNKKNVGTAEDIELLLKYILDNYPQILTWTRFSSLYFQPINSNKINNIYNINPLNERSDFLGGKTGTLPEAKENIAAIFQFGNMKISVVILGSNNRFSDLDVLLKWIKEAYKL